MSGSGHTLSPADAARWTSVGMLAALALLLSYAETFVPIPIPGVKLGLANIAVLVALGRRDVVGAVCVALIKVFAAGFLFGSPLTMAYSLTGTLLSLAGMIPLSRLRTMRLWMVSVIGALLHEVGQLVVASALLGTTIVWYVAPVLMICGCVTGVLCGVLATRLLSALPTDNELRDVEPRTIPEARPTNRCLVAFVVLVAFTIAVLHCANLRILGIVAVVAVALDLRDSPKVVRLCAPVFVLTLVLHAMAGANDPLAEAGVATLRLVSMAAASMAFMRMVPTNDLTSTMAWVVSPLTRAGVRTQGFLLAFDVAVRLIPTLSEIVRETMAEQRDAGVRALPSLLPHLVRKLYERA